MPSDFLSRLAQQLKVGKTPACRRSIQRILAMTKVKFAAGLYTSQTEAENEFRKLAEAVRNE
jgi:hypothetical protein